MVDFSSMENIQILISHRELYPKSRTIDEIAGVAVNGELLSLLSMLAFENNEEKKFRQWTLSNLSVAAKNHDYAKTHVVYSRLKILECWKILLSKKTETNTKARHPAEMLSILHELFAKINDDEITGDLHQLFIKESISNARDDYWFKLNRAQEIFIQGKALAPYRAKFEQIYGFSIESYVNIIFMLIIRCHKVRRVDHYEPLTLDVWAINLEEVNSNTGIDIGLLIKIMRTISFSLDEGADFSMEKFAAKNDFSLFRDKPFLQLSENVYLPIEGKLVEELLFDNLFHKIHSASGIDSQYFSEFGSDFEKYVQRLVEEFCTFNQGVEYDFIGEFSFGKSAQKSPDAMILCEQDKTLLAIEVKSARYLDAIVSTDDSPNAIEASFQKLQYGPWEQVYKSLAKIVHEKKHPKITNGLSFLLLCVAMNEIPLSLQDHEIIAHEQDISNRFYAMSIHAFELLLVTANKSSDYTLNDILMSAYAARKRISAKTLILRFNKSIVADSGFYLHVANRMLARHAAYFERTE